MLARGFQSLGTVLQTSATVAKASQAVSKFAETNFKLFENTLKKNPVTIDMWRRVDLGKGTAEELRMVQEANASGIMPDIIKAGLREKYPTNKPLSGFIRNMSDNFKKLIRELRRNP